MSPTEILAWLTVASALAAAIYKLFKQVSTLVTKITTILSEHEKLVNEHKDLVGEHNQLKEVVGIISRQAGQFTGRVLSMALTPEIRHAYAPILGQLYALDSEPVSFHDSNTLSTRIRQ